MFTKFTEKHLCWSLFLIKLLILQPYLKKTLAKVFSCEFCEIFKNTFFTEPFWKTASVVTNGQPFPLYINLEMCILFYNLESLEYFYMGIRRSLCHGFNFVNMRFVVKFRRIYFHGMFITELRFIFFSHTYSL